jgi:hypothetical protein
MTRTFRASFVAALALACLLPSAASAAPVAYTDSGADTASIQDTVDQFRADLGTLNANTAGTQNTGRREITWDGVADASADPNLLPPDFFNATSPRGVILVGGSQGVRVSADSSNPTVTPVEFGYTADFLAFSPERLFAPVGTTLTDVQFYVAGTSRPATVAGFGAVFTDVDVASRSQIVALGQFGQVLATVSAPTANDGLSFAGVRVTPGEQRIARVRVINGTAPVDGTPDSPTSDKVALDDFIYGEPAQPRLTISDAGTVTEGDDGSVTATFTVTRDVDTTSVFTVPYATLGDGAAEGSDYTGKSGTIAFNSGVLSRTIEVSVLGDKVDEVDEAFRVVLQDDGQVTFANGDNDGRAVIADNDPPAVSPSVTVTPTATPTPAPTTAGYDPSKDQTPPKLTVTGYPKGKKCARRDYTLRIKIVEDGLSSLRVKLDKTVLSDRARAAAVTERVKLRVPAKHLKKGKHTLRLSARDRGGNSASKKIVFRRC